MQKVSKKIKILAIETSCDETAVALLEARGGFDETEFKVLAHALYSQASKHAEFGGVYPNLAKREHAANLLPLITKALREADLLIPAKTALGQAEGQIRSLLDRHPSEAEDLIAFLKTHVVPDIDLIAVTEGPGLEPALWVGINFAESLGIAWQKKVIGINHMEGHIYSVLAPGKDSEKARPMEFPDLALLISGGHTELVSVRGFGEYEILGQTRDDAVGEAYDKSARLMGFPYPGGPKISALANEARQEGITARKIELSLPRPMIGSDDLDFSFSGLKTAVLYWVRANEPLGEESKKALAREIDDAVTEVLLAKVRKALSLEKFNFLIVAGGVIANSHIRKSLRELAGENDVEFLVPEKELSTDNAIMIGIAGYFKYLKKSEKKSGKLKAQGNLRLD